MAASSSKSFKIVLLGEGAVGKTSLVLRYVENKFNARHVSTLQASFLEKKLNINGQRIELSIWDTAGQEKFHALGPIYYRGSHGAVLVYDITDQDSFQRVQNWVKELRKMLGDSVCLSIAGNKIDLEKNRTVSNEAAEQFACSVGATHSLVSAKNNTGVEELFLDLARKMFAQNQQSQSANDRNGSFQARNSRNVLVVDNDDVLQHQQQPRKCC